MDSSPVLQAPTLFARKRKAVILTAALLSGAFATGFAIAPRSNPAPRVDVQPPIVKAPVTVNVPTAAPATVTVSMPPPAPPDEPPPRALAPKLWNDCVLPPTENTDGNVVCNWDAGFPAISADGNTIVRQMPIDDGGRGYYGTKIEFIDVKTNATRSITLVSPDESGVIQELEDGDKKVAAWTKLRKQVDARVAQIERTLASGKYRSLTLLDETDAPRGRFYAEVHEGSARIIDRETHAVILQRDFTIARSTPVREEEFCGGWSVQGTSLWLDVPTRTLLVGQSYRTGGCMCGDVQVAQVVHLP